MSINFVKEFNKFCKDQKSNFFGIYGAAGTGKTTCLEDVIRENSHLSRTPACVGPTWKAVNVLQERVQEVTNEGTMFQTIHKFLGWKSEDDEFYPSCKLLSIRLRKLHHCKRSDELILKYGGWHDDFQSILDSGHCECNIRLLNPIPTYYFVVCDEISMLNGSMVCALKDFVSQFLQQKKALSALLKRKNPENEIKKIIPSGNSKNLYMAANWENKAEICKSLKKITKSQLKIILVGDTYQLPPVKSRKRISDAFSLPMKEYQIHLTKIWRSTDDDIKTVYDVTRKNVPTLRDWNTILAELQHIASTSETVSFVSSREEFIQHYIDNNNKHKGDKIVILGTRNHTITEYNDDIQIKMRPKEFYDEKSKTFKGVLEGENFWFTKTYYCRPEKIFQFQQFKMKSVKKNGEFELFGDFYGGHKCTFEHKDQRITIWQTSEKTKDCINEVKKDISKQLEKIIDGGTRRKTIEDIAGLTETEARLNATASEMSAVLAKHHLTMEIQSDKENSTFVLVNNWVDWGEVKQKILSIKDYTFRGLIEIRTKINKIIWGKTQKYLASISFCHAMNSYKCQGETFDRVYIDWDDIMSCNFNDEKTARELYTVCSRSRKEIVFLSKKYQT